jgi:hypothetical protein
MHRGCFDDVVIHNFQVKTKGQPAVRTRRVRWRRASCLRALGVAASRRGCGARGHPEGSSCSRAAQAQDSAQNSCLRKHAREGSPASGITTRPRASMEEDAGNTKTPQCITESLQEMETQAQCSTSQLATKRVLESARTRPRQQCGTRQAQTPGLPAECTCTHSVCDLQTRSGNPLVVRANGGVAAICPLQARVHSPIRHSPADGTSARLNYATQRQ